RREGARVADGAGVVRGAGATIGARPGRPGAADEEPHGGFERRPAGGERRPRSVAWQEQPSLPAPGDRAQPTKNLTVDSKGVPLAAIDSRAASKGTIPDPELHEWTIAQAVAAGRTALVVFATPAFCE